MSNNKFNVEKGKSDFIKGVFFGCAWRDAVSRTPIYSKNADEKAKVNGKETIKKYLIETLLECYKENEIGPETHIEKIEKLRKKIEKTLKGNLLDGKFSFGHAQKLLNMMLKYYWCAGWMDNWQTKTPPDMPIDRKILDELKYKGEKSWSKFEKKDYKNLFTENKIILEIRPNLSEWELEKFGTE